jgi:replicative DNA helicase
VTPRPAEIAPITRVIERLDQMGDGEAPSGTLVNTGFPTLTRLVGGGWRRGDLIVVGGDVGVGTSAFALAMAVRAAMQQQATLFLSAEMSIDRVHERALAMTARVPLDAIRQARCTPEERAQLAASALALRDLPFAVSLAGHGGVADILRSAHGRDGAALIVVDGLAGLVASTSTQPIAEEQARAVVALKRMAIELDAAVLLTAKLPGLDRIRADRRPLLEDFGALRAVEEQADVVLGLYREELYGRDLGIAGASELRILKQRDGATTYLDLYYYATLLRFEDMVDR